MTEADFKAMYVTQFLATYMATRYDQDCLEGHVGKPCNHQPVSDAVFLANCAWDQIKTHVEDNISITAPQLFQT